MPTASWAFFSVRFTWPMAPTCILLSSERMWREPGTISPDRPCHSRERAAGHHVHAGCLTRVVLHGNARYAGHDRWQPDYAHPLAAGGWVCVDHQILSEQPPAHHLLADAVRQEGFRQLHQPAGTNHPAKPA